MLDHPITTDHVNLVQVLKQPNERYITHADLTFDGGSTVPADLGEKSRRAAGQTVTFPTRTFRTFEITIQDTNLGQLLNYGGVSPVGFAEIRLRDDQPGARAGAGAGDRADADGSALAPWVTRRCTARWCC